ncbi:hypothetical protein [Pyrinomonas methylaliphatogenes]|uniref:Uncharacterized protein n=1 Tax=Pyrinomonas methylaliphatogenes TaxID=454194 RepID=A0A0B6WW13_9BACT|nr:hypothetical protein [Pyrinomonas methylaliphatogenes]MBX5477554.1 hypothetical protein [Pyrinomonas methylaliphatogenes]CDM64464.1 hypothetical protein PYK22_00458 [Pyrinomonas methylaliphatogenes]
MRCPYCERPLHRWGTYCRACRRNVWRWPHLLLFAVLLVIGLFALWEIFIAR